MESTDLKVMLASGLRTAVKNEIKVSFGGQLMIHALVQLNENENPMHVDYYNLHGSLVGTIQHGIVKWIKDDVCFCMASPGKPRPTEFESKENVGHTLSQWRQRDSKST